MIAVTRGHSFDKHKLNNQKTRNGSNRDFGHKIIRE